MAEQRWRGSLGSRPGRDRLFGPIVVNDEGDGGVADVVESQPALE
jgi:hypothetical protein